MNGRQSTRCPILMEMVEKIMVDKMMVEKTMEEKIMEEKITVVKIMVDKIMVENAKKNKIQFIIIIMRNNILRIKEKSK
jgi:hypothetical protein